MHTFKTTTASKSCALAEKEIGLLLRCFENSRILILLDRFNRHPIHNLVHFLENGDVNCLHALTLQEQQLFPQLLQLLLLFSRFHSNRVILPLQRCRSSSINDCHSQLSFQLQFLVYLDSTS